MAKTTYILTFLILVIHLTLRAQENRYMVYFSDKNNTPYSVTAPEKFLSAKAIDRRKAQDIDITVSDLPVDPQYVAGLRQAGVDVFYHTKWLNGALIQSDQSLIASIEALAYVDTVIYAAPGARLTKNSRKLLAEEDGAGFEKTDAQLEMLGLDMLHQNDYRGENLVIAFFDGGFISVENNPAFQHVFTENRLKYAFNLVENNHEVYQYSTHGMKVFSVVAGQLDGEFTGAATDADYMLFVTEDVSSEYRIEEYNWLIAAEKADSAGVDIVNSSIGYFDFDDSSMNYSYADMNGNTTIVAQAVEALVQRGVVVVTSAGNEGNKPWKYITSPGDARNILAVGAVNIYGQISAFSSVGPTSDGRIKPDAVAMGSSTSLISQTGGVTSGSGTSYAAPLITGFAAALWQSRPGLTNLELIEEIRSIGNRADDPDNQYGYGVPDYYLIAPLDPDVVTEFMVYPNPNSTSHVTISMYPRQELAATMTLTDMTGKLLYSKRLQFSRLKDKATIDISHLKAGLYILQLHSVKGVEKLRIIKY